ncbi:tetratricopeptide repeat protein [Parasphingorhabdus halotolerans]|uniref:Tetratricopeptide repeat protein n=1 Tax=Parasphingorhabdus halotolerans TaxID=2725558 RepID=A0A6H2DPX9_9SPHN|nr:tetratricopeptide repeat protein [Parasphingorhabdus halotolerans]QJB70394.1 hypothetical protein HF685_14900 [Parasphingorhabdus halotolerans]
MTAIAHPPSASKPVSRKLPMALLILLAGLLIAFLTIFLTKSEAEQFDPLDENLPLAFGPKNFDAAIEKLDQRVDLNKERVARDGEQWSYQEGLALAALSRAQLSAEFEDYLLAAKSIDRAASLAPEGAGPGLAIGVVNLSLHRNRKAAEGIELAAASVVKPDVGDLVELEAMRGDIAIYGGYYSVAFEHFERATAQLKDAGTLFRLANWHKYRGEFDQAIALYNDGAKIVRSRTPQRLAVYLLQIGALELQQGNWDIARRYFERADAVFPGYWLSQAHVAQMDAAQGNFAKAEKAYLDIIARTDNPDVMAALITLYKHEGRDREATVWSKRAGAIWDKRVNLLPETYYDHAFDHAMGVGDVKLALALAQKNYTARPYGDAAIGLARGLVANGEPGQAISLLEKQEKAGWRSVELFAAMANAYEAVGMDQKATEKKNRTLAINPKAFTEAAGLLAFGSH